MAGFGFIKQAAQKAGKKMYGHGIKGHGAEIAGFTALGGAAGYAQYSNRKDNYEGKLEGNMPDSEVFKTHTEAWLRLTEFPGAFDRRRWDWKKTTDKFMKDPAYVEFLKAKTIEDKYSIIRNKLHPAFKESPPKEIMNTISDRLRG